MNISPQSLSRFLPILIALCLAKFVNTRAQEISSTDVMLPALVVDGVTYWDVGSVKNVNDPSNQKSLVRITHRGGTTDFPADLDYDRGYSLNLTKNVLEEVRIEIERAREWASDKPAANDGSSFEIGKRPEELLAKKPKTANGDAFIKAIKGDSSAMLDLALQFHYGINAPWDHTKSEEWLKKAGDSGNETAEAFEIVFRLLADQAGDADRAFEILNSAADRGDGRVLLFQGLCHENGWGCERNPSAALAIYEKLAAQNDVAALYLGNAHATGLGTPVDQTKAIAIWEKVGTPCAELQFKLAQAHLEKELSPSDYSAARQLLESACSMGYVPAMLELSVLYLSEAKNSRAARDLGVAWTKATVEADPENQMGLALMGACHLDGYLDNSSAVEAFVCFAKAASLGNGYAMTVIGQMAEQGIGTARDPGRAFLAYQRAAASDNLDGIFHLGRCYREGIGTQTDPVMAARMWEQGAESGNAACIGALAQCYFTGIGVDTDPVRAIELCKRGIESGDPSSLRLYGKHLVAAGQRGDHGESGIELLLNAANQFDTGAMMELGRLNEQGIGLEVNMAEAFTWYLRAAVQGDPSAMYKVGECFQLGRGRSLSHEQAAVWWRMGAYRNQPDCLNALAMVFKDGFGIVPEDRGLSFELARKSAEAGSREAECNLALCYFEGIGTAKDEAKGLEILVAAVGRGNPRAKPLLARYKSQVDAAKLGPLGALLQASLAEIDLHEFLENAAESWRASQEEFWQSYQNQAAYDRHIRNVTGNFR